MNDVRQTTIDATLAAAGSKATYAGAGASLVGWFTSSEAGVVIGIALGVLGLLINVYFKHREDKRQQEEHETRMRAIRGDYL